MRLGPKWSKLAIQSEIELAMGKLIHPKLNKGESICPVIFRIKERTCKK